MKPIVVLHTSDNESFENKLAYYIAQGYAVMFLGCTEECHLLMEPCTYYIAFLRFNPELMIAQATVQS